MEAKKALLQVDGLIKPMEGWFVKLPAFPTGVKDFIVTITPWLALIFGILGLLGSIAALGFGAFLSPLLLVGGGTQAVGAFTINVLIGLVFSVLTLIAVSPLLKRKMFGWLLLFWSEILSVVGAVLTLSLGGILVSLIGFYILFQIKHYYK